MTTSVSRHSMVGSIPSIVTNQVHGGMAAWVHGRMGAWVHGTASKNSHGPMDPWTHGPHGLTDPQTYRPTDLPEKPCVEGKREQIGELVPAGDAARVGERHGEVAAELPENLPARAARRRRRLG